MQQRHTHPYTERNKHTYMIKIIYLKKWKQMHKQQQQQHNKMKMNNNKNESVLKP